jgi:amino acid transporter
MATIYYLSTVFFLLVELIWIINPIRKTKEAEKFSKMSKEFKDKKWDDYSEEYKAELRGKMFLLFVPIWLFLGLFTFQWVGFLFIWLFNLIIIYPISKLSSFNMVYTIIHWINSVIGFAFGIFVIINHYHLKIDLTEYFFSIF